MRITNIAVENFRLLKDITITLESETTVIVGRNNSGKTSLTELFRRIVAETPRFTLDDFNSAVHNDFWEAFLLYNDRREEKEIREKLPKIKAELIISYDDMGEDDDLGVLSEFIVDLDPAVKKVKVVIQYRTKDGSIEGLFQNLEYRNGADSKKQKNIFYRQISDQIPKYFSTEIISVDPTDESNTKSIEFTVFRSLIQAGFISAQRGLDDKTHQEKDVLGKILSNLFSITQLATASENDKESNNKLNEIVSEIQEKVDDSFNDELTKMLPVLSTFGYPGLADPKLQTETTLDTKKLLDTHTKIRYQTTDSNSLPETYNGLGSRNLLYILFSLYEFFKEYKTQQTSPGIHIIFIEEPEAHLHPQMQEVFIHQLRSITKSFSKNFNDGITWPVQFVVTTHSTHMANKAPFDTIRYFLRENSELQNTEIKDLREWFQSKERKEEKEFLHKYLTLTRCDLFFADKAILIEGPTERILMPKIIEKIDKELSVGVKLASQYISVVEIGGAYAHHFYEFIDFLELKTLIITDLDSTKANANNKYIACKVSEGEGTSNASIKKWFSDSSPATFAEITTASDSRKVRNYRRIAFQVPEQSGGVCGRSFEAAFILANPALFDLTGDNTSMEESAWAKAKDVPKTDFALEYAIEQTVWNVPLYIREGLLWLSENSKKITVNSSEVKPIDEVDNDE